jgi:3',5'-cyclic AMP phosphodiesterase CpdA
VRLISAVAAVVCGVGSLLATAAPLATVPDSVLKHPTTLIAYGDTRFTDAVAASDARARRALVQRIADEDPDGVLISGDVPYHGGVKSDYDVYREETAVWRAKQIRVFPALGNHEFGQCDVAACLDNWWSAFPELRGHRWYSVQLGSAVHIVALDSMSALADGSEQRRWLESDVSTLPKNVKFVILTLHHPPLTDAQPGSYASHNVRPNEAVLADYLKAAARATSCRFLVVAGHVHNYERFQQDDVTYLVSGGGGATPAPLTRDPADLYRDPSFPNFHYVKLTLDGEVLRGEMFRLADAAATKPEWQRKDTFEIRARRSGSNR